MFTVPPTSVIVVGFPQFQPDMGFFSGYLLFPFIKNQPKNNSEQKEVGKGSGRH